MCLNNGSGNRVNVTRNTVSCLDLTLVSGNMSNICEWNVNNDTNIGIDHFLMLCSLNFDVCVCIYRRNM